MAEKQTDLSSYDSSWYKVGVWAPVLFLWYFVKAVFFLNPLVTSYWIKRSLLRLFGSKLGRGLVIKQGVSIKFPWRLNIGEHVWMGENVWIENQADVTIGSHSCLSQGACLLTGNHNHKKEGFDLLLEPIDLENGVWIGARAVVCPGVRCETHAILTVNSVATHDLEAYSIYQGNPATKVKERNIE